MLSFPFKIGDKRKFLREICDVYSEKFVPNVELLPKITKDSTCNEISLHRIYTYR